MMLRPLRNRMLLVALVPMTLVVLLVVGLMWSARSRDIAEAHEQQGRLLLGQLTRSSEYGLFSENLGSLKSIVNAVRREPYVTTVAIFDARGALLMSDGANAPLVWEQVQSDAYIRTQQARQVSVFAGQVLATEVTPLEDIYSQVDARSPERPVLGYVLVELSQAALTESERNALWSAIGVALVGGIMGGLLATLLAQRVMRPIRSLSSNIEKIGRGDFDAQTVSPNDPLSGLQKNLNRMAEQLAVGREELERQIANATTEVTVQRDEAERANRAKTQFLAAASHDLRQPTHALGMFVARLGQLPLESQAAEIVGYLGESVQSMQDLLDALLDVSRLESGTVKPRVQACSLQDMLHELQTAATPLAQERGLRLRIVPTQLWAETDPILLRRMVMNLVHNAIRYTRAGSVLVTCRPVDAGASVRIDVSDTGIGIAEELHQAVFKEFFQAANPERDRGKGLGLGLNIVQRTATLLGHEVSLRSAPGCGSRFSLKMRRLPPQVSSPLAERPTELPEQVLSGLRVVVIENDSLAREALVNLLRSWECEVLAYSSLPEVLQSAELEQAPDFVISDYRLGNHGDGLDAIQAIRQRVGTQVRACLISGDTDPDLIRKVADSGHLLLHKPVRPAKLRSILRHLKAPL